MDTQHGDQWIASPRHGTAGVRGFTMIEMLMAIVILAILAALAVPSFRNASLSSALGSAADNLMASVQLARSEAIKRNRVITLCTSADGATCATGGWQQGWIVVDAATGVVYQQQPALAADLRVSQAGGTAAIGFQPIGVGATAATLTICRVAPVGNQERVLTITATGIAHVTRTTTGTCP